MQPRRKLSPSEFLEKRNKVAGEDAIRRNDYYERREQKVREVARRMVSVFVDESSEDFEQRVDAMVPVVEHASSLGAPNPPANRSIDRGGRIRYPENNQIRSRNA